MFDTKAGGGASKAAQKFAQNMSDNMPQLAEKIDALADLQNVCDLLLLATLIKQDKLDTRVGFDLTWALDATAHAPEKLPAPKNAETLVHIVTHSIASGGVSLSLGDIINEEKRQADTRKIIPAAPRAENWLSTVPHAVSK